MKKRFHVTGMTCAACSACVEKAARSLQGVEEASVNLLAGSMQVSFDESKVSSLAIVQAVKKAGYGAFEGDASHREESVGNSSEDTLGVQRNRLVASLCFLVPLLYLSMGSMVFLPMPNFFVGRENALLFAFAQFLLLLPIMYLNRGYYIHGFGRLLHGTPNMDSLVGMGSMAAAVFGIFAVFRIGWGMGHADWSLVETYWKNLYFDSAGMIVVLVSVGKYLEARAKGQTGAALRKLMEMVPQGVSVFRDGAEHRIPLEQLVQGDEVLVRPGECVPADGIVTFGQTSMDESSITGESMPVMKREGDLVTSSAVNQSGMIRFRAERVGKDSFLSCMIQLVEEAGASKAPMARLADRVAGVFVPVVIAIAVFSGGAWLFLGAGVEFALSIAISVLVVSCPCALGLAVPAAIMVGIGKGAEHGILIKSAEALETAHDADMVIFDKTGTLTEGDLRVTDVIPVGRSEQALLSLAAGLEAGSEHPLAHAVLKYAGEREIVPERAGEFQAFFGQGVSAMIRGKRCLAGSERFLWEQDIELGRWKDRIDSLSEEGKTPLLFAVGHELAGILAVADMERKESRETVRQLLEDGISVLMLTGDQEQTAGAVAKRLGISQVRASVRPEEKEGVVAQLQAEGYRVAMAGDGVNDAPALMRADFGMAVGKGHDIAVESADAVLLSGDLRGIVQALRLSKAVVRNMKQNLFWAFFYNSIAIPVAAGCLYPWLGIRLSPMLGAAAMSLSSFCVVTNALRLRSYRMESAELMEPCENDAVEEQTVMKESEGQSMKKELKIEGMMCKHCQRHVTEALAGLEDVISVEVSLESKTALVEMRQEISAEKLREVIEAAGYELAD